MASWADTVLRGRMIAEQSRISLNCADTAGFIRLYQREELLWNVNLPDHTKRSKRSESLQRISKLMGKNWSIEQVKDKIMSLRSRYSKEIVKVRVSMASGADPCYQPIWRYFPMLDSFLRPFASTRKIDTPVVRAFHKRLMDGGVTGPGNQFQTSPPTPAATNPHTPQDRSPSLSPHFLHPPRLTPAGHCQRIQQNASLPHLSHHGTNKNDDDDDDDDDDDVQFVGQDDVSRMMEEVAMLIEDEGGGGGNDNDDDGDSGYSGGNQEGSSISDSLLENTRSSTSGADSMKRQASSTEGEWGINRRGCGEGESVTVDNDGKVGRQTANLPLNSESICSKAPVSRQPVHPPPHSECWTQSTAILGQTESGSVSLHQSTPVPKHSREGSGMLMVKQERPACLQSPPPPPLPQRLPSADLPTRDGSVVSHGAGSGMASGSLQGCGYDNSGSDPTLKRGPCSTDDPRECVHEPFLKRIKQEKDSTSCTDSSLCGEDDDPHSYQMPNEAGQLESPHPGSGLNPAASVYPGMGEVSKDLPGRSLNPASSSYSRDSEISDCQNVSVVQRYVSRTSPSVSGCAVPPSKRPTCRKDTESPALKDVHDSAAMACQVTHQVTEAVSSQLSSLLQSLVTSLMEKSSGHVGDDADTAFTSYLKAELEKLDEDLKADVKFSIQKVIYDAQKEMSRRKTCSN